MEKGFSGEQIANFYDAVPVADGNQFAGTGVGQPGHGQPAAEIVPSSQIDAGEGEASPDTETDPEPASGAPEQYSFENASQYDAKVLQSFEEAAREANLTQDSAQALLSKVAPTLAQRQAEQVNAIHQQWIEASTNDKEFGGEKLKENLGIARRGLELISTPEDRKFLDESGLGNHPAIIRMAFRAGKAISEDGYVGGNPGATETRSMAEILYGGSK
jgi:hypothetical protein